MHKSSSPLRVLGLAAREFFEDECPMLAAAISFYAVFSLPPLIYALLAITDRLMDSTPVETAILLRVRELVGPGASAQVYTMLHSVRDRAPDSGLAAVMALAALVFAATGVFVQIQTALNRAWNVQNTRAVWHDFLVKRLLSFLMILFFACLLLISLGLTAAVSAFGDAAAPYVGPFFEPLAYLADWIVALAIATLFFMTLFKWMPDAKIRWRDTAPGAFLTAILFTASKLLIGIYIGTSNVGQTYGAAGALALIMVWIYYAAMVLLFGAEVTHAWTIRDTDAD